MGGTLSFFVNATGDTQDIKFQIPGLDTVNYRNEKLRRTADLIRTAVSDPDLAKRGLVMRIRVLLRRGVGRLL